MRLIVYAGNDFSEICSVEIIERAETPSSSRPLRCPDARGPARLQLYAVRGRAGAPVHGHGIQPRLHRDGPHADSGAPVAQLAGQRQPDPARRPRNRVPRRAAGGASDWSNLFEASECELTFTLFDPIGWGAERVERTASFTVGGNWPTLPEFRVVAAASDHLLVSLPSAGKGIRVDYNFAGGKAVVIDCAGETVEIDGAGAVPTLYWFDRWDERIGLLRVVGELVHTEELNGEDTLEFQSYEVPSKGGRLLWLDGSTWREHVVVRTDESLAGL